MTPTRSLRPPELGSEIGDGELVRRMAQGDTAALAALYDRYAPLLLACAARIAGSREAPDLAHDVFLESWRSAASYDAERGSVRTWLLVRLRSRALDRMALADSTRTRPLTANEPAPERSAPTTGSADAVDRIAVRQALAQLPLEVRQALEQSYFDGLTAREIAEREQVPIGTIKSRIARGLSALERLLELEERGQHAG